MPQPGPELIAEAESSGCWDAVADWCEAFDWAEAEGMPAAEFYLECVVAVCPRNDQQVVEAVAAARTSGIPWDRIGQVLELSAQAAERRYGPLIDTHQPAR